MVCVAKFRSAWRVTLITILLDTVLEVQSECGVSGKWSAVSLVCHPKNMPYQFGLDVGKDFLVIIICCIFLIITAVSVAIASRLIVKRLKKI